MCFKERWSLESGLPWWGWGHWVRCLGFLTHDADEAGFMKSWGWTSHSKTAVVLARHSVKFQCEVTMFQRGPENGATLGNHRLDSSAHVEARGVQQVSGVDYVKVDDQGLHVKCRMEPSDSCGGSRRGVCRPAQPQARRA